jgi:hypothetical protein
VASPFQNSGFHTYCLMHFLLTQTTTVITTSFTGHSPFLLEIHPRCAVDKIHSPSTLTRTTPYTSRLRKIFWLTCITRNHHVFFPKDNFVTTLDSSEQRNLYLYNVHSGNTWRNYQ